MSTIFEHAIAYVEDLALFEHVEPQARGVAKGLAIKLQDSGGNPVIARNAGELYNGADRRLRGLGYSLGIWSVPRKDPVQAATVASYAYGELGLSFAVFETEWEYKSDGGKIDVKRLLDPWRILRPKALTACATEGRPPSTFNHAAAIAAGCRLLPENYWKVNGDYAPKPCFQECKRLGWNLARVHPTLTGVEGHDMATSIRLAYEARPVGFTRGVALWRGDLLSDDDWRLLRAEKGDLFL